MSQITKGNRSPEMQAYLTQFAQLADHPKAQFHRYLEEGQAVVGCFPLYTPEEVVHAMGFVPFGVWGADRQVEGAKAYFPAFIASLYQTALELGMQHTYDGMTAVLIPALSDALKALGENWKYAVPQIHFIPVSYPQNRRLDCGRAFTRSCYERVARQLHELTGRELKEDALLNSIRIYNEHNQLMRQLDELQAQKLCLTAKERRDVFKSAWFMRKEEHNELLKSLLREMETLQTQPVEEGLRIQTSGLLCDHPALLQILDDIGFVIVADDVAAESRQYRTDANLQLLSEGKDALDLLVDKFARMDHCSMLYDPDKKRASYLVELAKARHAKGMVLFLTKFCDPEEFDYVPIKRAFEKAEIPLLLIEIDRQMERFDQAQTALETFRDLLELN